MEARVRMGKYIKKAKGTGEVAVMDVSFRCLGVRTRARTLALQRDAAGGIHKAAPSYLQLRSRRLVKPAYLSSLAPEPTVNQAQRVQRQETSDSNKLNTGFEGRGGVANSTKPSSVSMKSLSLETSASGATLDASVEKPCVETETCVEVSFGENTLDFHDGNSSRSIRETTPCSFTRNSESRETPGSTTRPTNQSENNIRVGDVQRRSAFPTALEMEEFFAGFERQHQRRFTEKYNYDPVDDLPLAGRYEWIRL